MNTASKFEINLTEIPSKESLQELMEMVSELEGLKEKAQSIESKIHSTLSGVAAHSDTPKEGEKNEEPKSARQARKAPQNKAVIGRRGKVKMKILSELKKAGKRGITIDNLAKSLGLKKSNVSVWFSVTGKKDSRIQRIAPGTYRLANGGNGNGE